MAALGGVHIRRVRALDAAALSALYRPYAESSLITFETVPPTPDDFAARIAKLDGRYPWLVAEDAGEVLGYAYAGVFRERPAYRFTVETSIYLAQMACGRGIGPLLYAALLDIMIEQGFVHAIGAITLPNPASIALHERFGFACVGSYPDVGYKLGQWATVGLYQKTLGPLPADPAEPAPLSASARWAAIDP